MNQIIIHLFIFDCKFVVVEYASTYYFFNVINIYIICGCFFSLTNSVDDCNWDSPLNRLPESTAAFRILKHSFAVRGNKIYAYRIL